MVKYIFISFITLLGFTESFAATWNGYECTVDCSGHEAGYEWAEENSIDDPSDCYGNSNSFNEGCETYVEEYEDQEEQ